MRFPLITAFHQMIPSPDLVTVRPQVTESVARSSSEPPDFSRLAEEVARGTCVALTPHLPLLADSERTRIGLRATVDSDTVGRRPGRAHGGDGGGGGQEAQGMFLCQL